MERSEIVRNGLVAAIALAVSLGVAEGSLRAYASLGTRTGEQIRRFDPLKVLYEPHGEFGYRQPPGSVRRYGNGATASSNAMGYRGPLVSPAKPPGTYRILLLGGSTTHGYGVNDDETIDAHMRDLLAQEHPDRHFEVVNLALGGYDSYQVFERMRSDGLDLAPDLVVVNSGINDVRNARFPDLRIPDRRTLIWEDHMQRMREEARRGGPALGTRLKHVSYLARLPGFLRGRFQRRQDIEAIETVEPDPGAVDYFETNLRRTADLVESVGAALLFSTPASALRYEESGATSTQSFWVVDAATTEEYRQALARRMQRVAEELAASGRRVAYVSHELPRSAFLDDCHLTDAGNRAVAANLIAAAEPFLQSTDRRESAPRTAVR